MVARPKPVPSPRAADRRIAALVVGPQRDWETAAEYEALLDRLAVLVAQHRGPQAEYRNERPGFVHHSRRGW